MPDEEHEPNWQRDARLKAEESRMVKLESNVLAIRGQTTAIRELFDEERKQRRAAEEALERHERADSEKFASIDSRLQGAQAQLAGINDILKRIESKVDGHEPRISGLEDDRKGRTAVAMWLRSAWVQLGIGGGVGGTLVALYTVLAG